MKKFKGFTLIECIVALAVLGIASLVMAQIYANVSWINRRNHDINSSLAYQMQYVEKKLSAEAVEVKANEPVLPATGKINTQPPHLRTGVNNITIKRVTVGSDIGAGQTYSCAVDYYVLQSRDQNNEAAYTYNSSTNTWVANPNYTGNQDDNYYLNYKYFVGHSN